MIARARLSCAIAVCLAVSSMVCLRARANYSFLDTLEGMNFYLGRFMTEWQEGDRTRAINDLSAAVNIIARSPDYGEKYTVLMKELLIRAKQGRLPDKFKNASELEGFVGQPVYDRFGEITGRVAQSWQAMAAMFGAKTAVYRKEGELQAYMATQAIQMDYRQKTGKDFDPDRRPSEESGRRTEWERAKRIYDIFHYEKPSAATQVISDLGQVFGGRGEGPKKSLSSFLDKVVPNRSGKRKVKTWNVAWPPKEESNSQKEPVSQENPTPDSPSRNDFYPMTRVVVCIVLGGVGLYFVGGFVLCLIARFFETSHCQTSSYRPVAKSRRRVDEVPDVDEDDEDELDDTADESDRSAFSGTGVSVPGLRKPIPWRDVISLSRDRVTLRGGLEFSWDGMEDDPGLGGYIDSPRAEEFSYSDFDTDDSTERNCQRLLKAVDGARLSYSAFEAVRANSLFVAEPVYLLSALIEVGLAFNSWVDTAAENSRAKAFERHREELEAADRDLERMIIGAFRAFAEESGDDSRLDGSGRGLLTVALETVAKPTVFHRKIGKLKRSYYLLRCCQTAAFAAPSNYEVDRQIKDLLQGDFEERPLPLGGRSWRSARQRLVVSDGRLPELEDVIAEHYAKDTLVIRKKDIEDYNQQRDAWEEGTQKLVFAPGHPQDGGTYAFDGDAKRYEQVS